MNILAVDQARHGGWSVFDYESKRLVECGYFNYEPKSYSFDDCLVEISDTVLHLAEKYDCSAVFIEDVQMQRNVNVLKQLARLQGALLLSAMKKELLIGIVTPSQWQSYCRASGRTQKEIKAKIMNSNDTEKRRSKILSMEFVDDTYGVKTQNDNMADAICIGHYVVHNIELKERKAV